MFVIVQVSKFVQEEVVGAVLVEWAGFLDVQPLVAVEHAGLEASGHRGQDDVAPEVVVVVVGFFFRDVVQVVVV